MKLTLDLKFTTREVGDAVAQIVQTFTLLTPSDGYAVFAQQAMRGTLLKNIIDESIAVSHLIRLPQTLVVMNILAEFLRATVHERYLDEAGFRSDVSFDIRLKAHIVTLEITIAEEFYKGTMRTEPAPEPSPVFKRRFRGGVLQ